MRPLGILLIEDDISECQALQNYIDTIEDICLVGTTNNVMKAIELVSSTLPDAIILDLELHNGNGNGLLFLTLLQKLDLTIRPYILITTNNISHVTHEHARSQGADFIMTKCQIDYSAQNVIEFLYSLKDTLHKNAHIHKFPLNMTTTESIEELSKRILNRIDVELNLIGINPKMIGKEYLRNSILHIIHSRESKPIALIAKEYKKSYSSVERAMQNAINKTWNSTDTETLAKYYTAYINNNNDAPTVMQFIYYYADKLKRAF